MIDAATGDVMLELVLRLEQPLAGVYARMPVVARLRADLLAAMHELPGDVVRYNPQAAGVRGDSQEPNDG